MKYEDKSMILIKTASLSSLFIVGFVGHIDPSIGHDLVEYLAVIRRLFEASMIVFQYVFLVLYLSNYFLADKPRQKIVLISNIPLCNLIPTSTKIKIVHNKCSLL